MLIRQTNIIWVVFLAIERAFDLLDYKMHKLISQEQYSSVIYLKVSRSDELESFIIFKFTSQ